MAEGEQPPAFSPDMWDKFNRNPLHYKKKKGAKNEFGLEYESIIPSEGEIRLLGNRAKQCEYYRYGVEFCHLEMVNNKSETFLPCKEPIDAMYRWYTEDKYGSSIRDAPKFAKPYEKEFYNCLFRPASGTDLCMSHFHDVVRSIYRSEDTQLCDWY